MPLLKPIYVFLVLLIFASALIGCGGNSSETGTTGGTGGGGVAEALEGPGPRSATIVPAAVRYAAMDRVSAKYDELFKLGEPNSRREADLAAFIKTVPEFKQSGIRKDGTIWGRFEDNSYYCFNNRDLSEDVPSTATSPKASNRSIAQRRVLAAATVPVVDGKKAILFDVFAGAVDTPNDFIAEQLTRRGFQVSAQRATLENLRTVSNESVFYVSSHGCSADSFVRPGHGIWSMWTDTLATARNDETYIDDLQAGRLVVFEARYTKELPFTNSGMERRYGITAEWIKHYGWSFTKNSVAFLNHCYSALPGCTAEALRHLPTPVGATLGWSNAASSEGAWASARYFFDRALGTNAEKPILEGGSRPFDLLAVYRKMTELNLDVANTTAGVCQLIPAAGTVDNMMLAPSVMRSETFEPVTDGDTHKPTVRLYGEFGASAPAHVRIGGTEVKKITYVDSNTLDCETIDTPGAGFSGEIEVETASGVKSNRPLITEWTNCIFEYHGDPLPLETGGIYGSIQIVAPFRASIHKYREQIDGDLIEPPAAYARSAGGATADWQLLGPVPGAHWTTPSQGAMPKGLRSDPSPYGSGFFLDLKIDRDAGTIGVAFNFLGAVANYIFPGGVTPSTVLIPSDTRLTTISLDDNMVGGPHYVPSFTFSLDTNLKMVSETVEGNNFALLNTYMKTAGSRATHAPTASTEQDANH